MNRWFTSDLHFGHRNVIEYCDRPYKDAKEMDIELIKQWNSQVKPGDEVWFLGDFGINKRKCLDKDLLSQLNGTKYIVIGNHDSFFVRGHKNPVKFETQYRQKYLDAGWAGAYTSTYLMLEGGHHVHLSHLPPDSGVDNRYSQFKVVNCPALTYLHGHLHGHYRKDRNMIDVAFDGELKLLSENDVVNLIESNEVFIPTRLTKKFRADVPLMLMPFEAEVKTGYLRRVSDDDLVLYNYTDKCTYDRHWNDVTRYSRGLIFEKETGKIVAVPFPKFFNVGEMPETRLENLPDESYIVTEKMDGSLGIIYNYKGQWRVATRGSLTSEQAIKGQEILQKYDMSQINKDHTLLVEIIYPENKIVVNYGDEEKLVLLSAINREQQVECHRTMVGAISDLSGMPLVKEYNYTIDEMIELQKTIPKDDEGFVVRFDSGLRVKIKGHEYLRIHKLLSHMSPISFWETMENGKVKVDYLQELPEEYRKEAEELTKKLESNYKETKDHVLGNIDFMLKQIGLGDINDEEYRKKVGLYVKDRPQHYGAIFPYLLGKGIDRYVMKEIRPSNNVL